MIVAAVAFVLISPCHSPFFPSKTPLAPQPSDIRSATVTSISWSSPSSSSHHWDFLVYLPRTSTKGFQLISSIGWSSPCHHQTKSRFLSILKNREFSNFLLWSCRIFFFDILTLENWVENIKTPHACLFGHSKASISTLCGVNLFKAWNLACV